MATSLGLNERLFVVNPQEVHELVGTGRGPEKSCVLGVAAEGAGEGHREERGGPGSDCCWDLRAKWKEWDSVDGRFQMLGKGESWLKALKEREDLPSLGVPQETGALQGRGLSTGEPAGG